MTKEIKNTVFPPFYLFLIFLSATFLSFIFNIDYAIYMLLNILIIGVFLTYNYLKINFYAYSKNIKTKNKCYFDILNLILLMLLINIINFQEINSSNFSYMMPIFLCFNSLIWIIFIVSIFYIEELFSKESSFHDLKYYNNKINLFNSIKDNLKNKKFLKTYKYLQKYENYFNKVYKDYIYSSSDYYIFILFSKEEIKISKKKEIKLNKLKNKFEKSFNKLSLS